MNIAEFAKNLKTTRNRNKKVWSSNREEILGQLKASMKEAVILFEAVNEVELVSIKAADSKSAYLIMEYKKDDVIKDISLSAISKWYKKVCKAYSDQFSNYELK